MERLYFDYNATAPLAEGLRERLADWLREDPKNPSSAHRDGQNARAAIESARKTILKLLGADDKDRLFFTSGGSESNNTVLHSAFLNRGTRRKLLLTRVEHSCVFNYAKFLETQGAELVFIDVIRDGSIDLDDYARKLDADVFLVTAMLANNETGFVFPVKQMASLAAAKGIPFHCDVVCAAGKIPVSFADLGVDTMTFSSHKFGGLKGSGGVICKAAAKISPFVIGGSQEGEKRAGTQNVIGIMASAFALEVWTRGLAEECAKEVALRDLLKAQILAAHPASVFVESPHRLPQTLSAAFVGLNGNLLLTNLDLEGVSVSYGSACASGSLEVSRVMRELSLKFDEARAALRFSFGRGITAQHVEELGRRLKLAVARMS